MMCDLTVVPIVSAIAAVSVTVSLCPQITTYLKTIEGWRCSKRNAETSLPTVLW